MFHTGNLGGLIREYQSNEKNYSFIHNYGKVLTDLTRYAVRHKETHQVAGLFPNEISANAFKNICISADMYEVYDMLEERLQLR
jgi:hypothetical protein